jgi:hypothetical protein
MNHSYKHSIDLKLFNSKGSNKSIDKIAYSLGSKLKTLYAPADEKYLHEVRDDLCDQLFYLSMPKVSIDKEEAFKEILQDVLEVGETVIDEYPEERWFSLVFE